MRKGRKALYALGFIIVGLMLAPIFAFLVSHKPAPPSEEAVKITFRYPLSPGDKLTFLVTLKILPNIENATFVSIANQTIEYEVLSVRYPYLDVLVNGVNATIPALLLALPSVLVKMDNVDVPVKTYYLGDSFCMPMNKSISLEGVGYSGSTPGFCKKTIVYAVYDSDGVLRRMTITMVKGDYVYVETVERVIAVRHGEGVNVTAPISRVNPTCQLYYSPVIDYTLPGAYIFGSKGKYLLKQVAEALGERPLIVLRKSSEAQRVWEVLDKYSGPDVTVLVYSPALLETEEVSEMLSRLGRENAMVILPDGSVIYGADKVIEYLKELGG